MVACSRGRASCRVQPRRRRHGIIDACLEASHPLVKGLLGAWPRGQVRLQNTANGVHVAAAATPKPRRPPGTALITLRPAEGQQRPPLQAPPRRLLLFPADDQTRFAVRLVAVETLPHSCDVAIGPKNLRFPSATVAMETEA